MVLGYGLITSRSTLEEGWDREPDGDLLRRKNAFDLQWSMDVRRVISN